MVSGLAYRKRWGLVLIYYIILFGAYFLTPLLMTGLVIAGFELNLALIKYVIPLVIWIILGEMLLQADIKTKMIVAFVAFIIYIILIDVVGLPSFIYSLIPF